MYVKKIDWLDEVSKEAIVEVAEGYRTIGMLFLSLPIQIE